MDTNAAKKLVLGILALSFLASIVTQNGVIFTSTLMCLIIITPFGVAWCMDKGRNIHQLREKIRKYKPGEWTIRDPGNDFVGPPKIRLGVFGLTGSGKSSLLNSLHFAFRDKWQHIFAEGELRLVQGSKTMHRDPVKLTDYITTVDTRGLTNFCDSRVNHVIAEILGRRGMDTRSELEGEDIDCSIFVYAYSPHGGINECCEFLRSLSPQIDESHGEYPIMVVTFAEHIADINLIRRAIVSSRMDERSLFFIENYTAENHEMNMEKHSGLLEILDTCISRADDNITYKWRKERERRNTPSSSWWPWSWSKPR